MSKFNFYANGSRASGATIYDAELAATGEHLGLVARNERSGWSCWYAGVEVANFGTRVKAAEYLLVRYLMDANDPVVSSALPADPFDGVSA